MEPARRQDGHSCVGRWKYPGLNNDLSKRVERCPLNNCGYFYSDDHLELPSASSTGPAGVDLGPCGSNSFFSPKGWAEYFARIVAWLYRKERPPRAGGASKQKAVVGAAGAVAASVAVGLGGRVAAALTASKYPSRSLAFLRGRDPLHLLSLLGADALLCQLLQSGVQATL